MFDESFNLLLLEASGFVCQASVQSLSGVKR